ncbi:MAG: hypothetical protein WBS20_04435 [Lysobacterales bacterium]
MNKRLAAMLMVAAMPVLAQTSGVVETLVLPLSNDLNLYEMARVVTDKGRPAECLAPLAVTRIDGESRVVPAQGFLIEPGAHSLNGRATLDMAYCPLNDPNLYIGSAADLEVVFAAGSTYYIGYNHQPVNTAEWKLVVWQVEPTP